MPAVVTQNLSHGFVEIRIIEKAMRSENLTTFCSLGSPLLSQL